MSRAGVNGPGARGQAGAGLIEVMIALLVFAVGLLGTVALQLTAKKSSFEATQRSIATGLARDIIERMRSNPGQVPAYVIDDVGDTANPVTASATCTQAAAVHCSPGQLAAWDLADWYGLLIGATETVTVDGVLANAGGLVEPRACISNAGGNITVAIAWRGVNEMVDASEAQCGSGKGVYGDDDALRRVLVMTTYIGGPG
ncbi:type IV pilus modification protein PilV [Kineobactrum salinum]|uniref:Type IV pilus modification protein PilV n=1 Tax=Kineobactrum salinum TaxID=2708301 RepID=A0A6C0U332_9GAMM|nr:type IV pilus modification protein PilV [Kineobactrum salinum]QIB66348.1 type IV pilus modification protein PilV [Kineobactrum salinum]